MPSKVYLLQDLCSLAHSPSTTGTPCTWWTLATAGSRWDPVLWRVKVVISVGEPDPHVFGIPGSGSLVRGPDLTLFSYRC
jgi:hypothetical protein